MKIKAALWIFASVVCVGLLHSCSLKKNTAATRQYTAFITRYNIYFNGDQHYKETLNEMEKKYEDDYNRLLFMHPAESHADEKAPKPGGDFKRSIEKAQKAIQLRSIKKRPARKPGKSSDPEYKKWLKREEYNPFLHNAWMMMARSQYMNGDFLGAASTFFYISKHFTWLPATVTEARLWQARSYIAVDWLFEAESILTRIKESDLTNSTLRGLYAFDWADYYVRSRMWEEAVPRLQEAIAYAKGTQKSRLYFLLGQVYQQLGKRHEAYLAFRQAGKSSNISYRARFNARIKQSEVYEGSDISKEVKSLLSLTRQGSNREYLDQIYYAVGNLYLSRGDTAQAIDNYRLAINKSKRQAIDKALAEITLGRIYFAQGRYDLAQPCYSGAITQLPNDYPDYSLLKRQSDVLDELAVFSQSVVLQDSLLELSRLPVEEQRKVADRLAKELTEREKREAEDRKREEYLAEQAARGTGLQQTGAAQSASTFVMNTDNSWYFYNEATRNAGRTEFQKRWGTRRLEDDWRRRNKASFSYGAEETSPGADEAAADVDSLSNSTDSDSPAQQLDVEARKRLDDPHYPEYYLKQIPKTDAERDAANDVIRDALYNMALILKDKLSDYPAAEREFDTLMKRYPDNPYRLEVFDNLFLMYLSLGDKAQAETYRHLILSEFPDSKIAEAIRDDNYAERLMAADSIQRVLYDHIYEAYMNNSNGRVHEIYDRVRKDYPLSRIMPKFMFINALAYVTENRPEQFATQLRELVQEYPDVDVAPLAADYLRYLAAGYKLNSASRSNLRGMVWSTRLTADSTAVSLADAAEFDLTSTDTPRCFVLLYPTDAVETNRLLFDVARFNFNSFTVRDFDLETLTFGKLGMIVVKGFNNVADVRRYRSMLERNAIFKLPRAVIPVEISQSNFDILLSQGRSFEEYFNAVGDRRLEETHRATLPEDEYPSAEEMYNTEGLDKVELTDEEKAAETGATIPGEPTAEPQRQQPTPPLPAVSAPDASTKPAETPEREPAEFDVPIPEMPTAPPPKKERRLMPQKVAPAPSPNTNPAPANQPGDKPSDK